MKKWMTNALLALVFLTGLSIALYPTVSNQFNLYRASLLISKYHFDLQELTPEDHSDMIAACDEYNAKLVGGIIPDVFSIHSEEADPEYMSLLNLKGDGMMGSIEIPKIGETMPIYHTTFDDVLQNGVGHMEGSSLPVGGASTHCVLAGHRGLPSAKLFTDLDQIVEGDLFYLNVLNQTMIYQVDRILTVEPDETEWLAIEEGEDYVTLVTCTPYGINTQRLLVRGRRIYPEEIAEKLTLISDAQYLPWWQSAGMIAAPAFAAGLLIYLIFRRRK